MKNYGRVRGGCNDHGRLFLVVECDHDEGEALAESMRERWMIPTGRQNDLGNRIYHYNGGVVVKIGNRAGFSLVPAIVRWSCSAGRTIRVHHYDGEAAVDAAYPSAEFFAHVGQASMYVGL